MTREDILQWAFAKTSSVDEAIKAAEKIFEFLNPAASAKETVPETAPEPVASVVAVTAEAPEPKRPHRKIRLTKKKTKEIAKMIRAGVPQRQIAQTAGISRTTIQDWTIAGYLPKSINPRGRPRLNGSGQHATA